MSTPNNPSPAPNHQFAFMAQQQPQYGQPGPGPNTMAQNRPPMPAHQMQLLQQVASAARSQGMNLSPQQLSMVVAQMQNQGGNSNPQALMNALRSLGHGQGQGQGQGSMQNQGQGQGGQIQGRPGSSGQSQGQGQNPNPNPGFSPHMLQQQRIQQMMQNNQAMTNQNQQYGSPQARSGTPGTTDPRQSMPPPGPPMHASPRTGPAPPPPPGTFPNHPQQQQPPRPGFTLSAQQQNIIAQQQQRIMENPQFQVLPPQQQQYQLGVIHEKLFSIYMTQDAERQQQQQQQQQHAPPPQTEPSPHLQRQPTPQPATPQPGHPSSIPPHMAPPRPASAASHHAPSPHHPGSPMATNTPPPSHNQYNPHQPPNTSSPAMSVHSQAPTPQHHPQPPPHSQSPLAQHQTGPSPRQPVSVDVNGQMGQPNPTIRQNQPPVLPPGGYTPQQQQQMAAAMNIFGQAVQAQGQAPSAPQPPVRPGQGPINMNMGMAMGRPPNNQLPPNINPAEFPFDFRLIPLLRHAPDPRWQADMNAKNPQLLQAVMSAQHMITSGMVRQDVMQKMQQFYFATVNMGQQRPPPGSAPPSAIPPQMQQQFMGNQAQSAGGSGTPNQRDSSGSIGRPPPPHTIPESPAGDVPSGAGVAKGSTPTDTAMPPPTWIPGQPTTARPPPDTRTAQAQPGASGSAPGSLPVKEWEGSLRLDLPITQITVLPDENDDPTFEGKLPPMSDSEKEQVLGWMETDKAFAGGMVDRKKGVQKKMFTWARNNDIDTPWWSVRKGERYQPPRNRLQILFPQDKDVQRLRKTHRNRKLVKYTPAQLKSMANVEDHIIPIRIDIEHDHFRLKDTFMWNVSDTVVTPEMFASSICDDFGVHLHIYGPKIVAAINERVQEYRDQIAPIEQSGPSLKGKLNEGDEDGKALLEMFRRAQEDEDDSSPVSDEIRTDPGMDEDERVKVVTFEDEIVPGPSGERPMTAAELEEMMEGKEANEELRLLIKVEILVGNQNLTDTFEWDLNSEVTPEEFAYSYCTELGLSGEFITALSHDIHEQIMVQKRCLFLTGHIFGSGLDLDDEVKTSFLPPIQNVLRTEHVAMSTYTPIFATYTDEDIQAIERERERDSKRKRRATRARRGVILPDREPAKTHRSLLNPAAADGHIAPAITEMAAAAPVTSSRRAAAIAAQANINLLAQDLPLPQPPTPPPTHHPLKVGRGRGRGRGAHAHAQSSRNSPASFAHAHDSPGGFGNGEQAQTPLPSSTLKRSYMDDTGPETNSPIPKYARAQHTSSPTMVNSSSQHIKSETPSYASHRGLPSAGGGHELHVQTHMKRQSDDLVDPRTMKAPRLDAMLGGNGGMESNPGSRSDSPSTMSIASFPHTNANAQKTVLGREPSIPSSPSDSGSDSSDSDYGAPKKVKPVTISLNRRQSQSQTPAPGQLQRVTSGGVSVAVDPPTWVVNAHADLKSKYPQDAFNVVPRPKPVDQPDAIQEWRMKCLDCPGRIYSLGPAETLNNFEVHLKNRAHRANVENRTGVA